ncbi:outer dense fiber protein 3 [Trichonephila clavipes]|nr:outer dense fiber protein 3 [Trichonephila clavipes]
MLNGRTPLHLFDRNSDCYEKKVEEILEPYVRFFRSAVGLRFLLIISRASALVRLIAPSHNPPRALLELKAALMQNGYQNGTTQHSAFSVQQKPWTPTKRRGPISGEWQTPGPADITLPSTFGPKKSDATRSKSPAYTFSGKHEEKVKFATPGPGSYNVSGVRRTGKEVHQGKTISGRTKDPQPFKTPSPGEYTPERRTVLHKAPAFTFGHKGKETKPDNIPAPGTYEPEKSLKKMLDNAPRYSFRIKYKDPKPENVPGDVLKVAVGKKSTIISKIILNEFAYLKFVAPGAYEPEKAMKAVLDSTPRYSFRIKYREPKPDNVPAPGAYEPEKAMKAVLDSTPRYSFRIKHKEPKPDNVPVPTDSVVSRVFIESSALEQVVATHFGIASSEAMPSQWRYTPKTSCSVVRRKRATASALSRCLGVGLTLK